MNESQLSERVHRLVEADLVPVTPVPRVNLPNLVETACFKPVGCDDYLVIQCKPMGRHYQECPTCKKQTLLNIHS